MGFAGAAPNPGKMKRRARSSSPAQQRSEGDTSGAGQAATGAGGGGGASPGARRGRGGGGNSFAAKRRRKAREARARSGGGGGDARAAPAGAAAARSRDAGGSGGDSGSDGGAEVELSAVFGSDGTLYLLDKATNTVFSASERRGDGDLLRLGEWDAAKKQVVSPAGAAVPSTPAAASKTGSDRPAAGDAAPPAVSASPGAAAGSAAGDKASPAADEGSQAPAAAHPFEADPDDHCETAPEAYADIAPLLRALAPRLGRKDPSKLRIYDPYYCDGGVKARLAAEGFPRCYNENEDFYAAAREGRVPRHDVVVTNPPYSGGHIKKLLRFCIANGRPFFLLMPNWVVSKDYYDACLRQRKPQFRPGKSKGAAPAPGPGATVHAGGVFYLVPRKRYHYWTPRVLLRGKHTHTGTLGERTSPFVSFWYVGLGRGHTEDLVAWWRSSSPRSDAVQLARSREQLPVSVLDANDPRRKKARDQARRKARRQGGRPTRGGAGGTA